MLKVDYQKCKTIMKFSIFLSVILLFISCLWAFDIKSIAQTAKDVTKVAVKTSKGLAEKAPDLLSPEEIFDLGKQAIAGLPVEVLASAINKICSVAISTNATESERSVNNTELNYVLLTDDDNVTVPITNAADLWLDPAFNASSDVVIMVTGWTSDINDSNACIDTIWSSYKDRGNVNFVVIDTARFVDTLYTWSAFNTNELGEGLATGLSELVNYVPLEKIHLIGHSLGAHIVGSAGRNFQYMTNQTLPRITGLDPANPCFNEGEALSGISRGDADFVDIIHTNSKVLGKKDPIGDVDFYPNGIISVQPGCIGAPCSHARAWQLYAETVIPGHEEDLMAIKCNSISSLDTGACPGQPIPLGYAVPRTAKGSYFLKTNSKYPYGPKE